MGGIIPLEKIISWSLSRAYEMLSNDEADGLNYPKTIIVLYNLRKKSEKESPIYNRLGIESSIRELRKLYK